LSLLGSDAFDNIIVWFKTPDEADLEMFKTRRLGVRTWQEEDFASLHALLSDSVTMSHWPAPLDEVAARAWLDRTYDGMRDDGLSRWCCERLADGKIIGDVGIVRMQLEGQWINDLGYIVAQQYWRQGYAFEAVEGAVKWARSHRLDSLVANMATDNLPSVAVAEKLGMTKLREFRKANNQNKMTNWYELQLND